MKWFTFAQLISALVVLAMAATLARLIYHVIYWRDLARAAQSSSWWEWIGVAAFVTWLVWSAKRKEKFD